jgi:hypothetical protein
MFITCTFRQCLPTTASNTPFPATADPATVLSLNLQRDPVTAALFPTIRIEADRLFRQSLKHLLADTCF